MRFVPRILVLVLLSLGPGYPMPPTWVVPAGIERVTDVEPFLYYLPDSNDDLTAGEVLSRYLAGKAIRTDKRFVNFGFTSYPYWLVLGVKGGSRPSDLLLEITNNHIYYLDFYVAEKGIVKHLYQTGSFLPYRQRPLLVNSFAFPFTLGRQADKVLLLRLDRRQEVLKVPLKLWQRQAFEEASNAAYLTHGIVVGMLLFIIVFNLFLWISLRDPIHFYYCLYVLGLGLFSLADKGYGYQYLWPESPFLNHQARNFLALYNCAIQIHFMQLFVGQTATNSRYYRLNNVVKVLLLVLAVVPFFSPGAYFPTYVINTYTVLAGAGMLASIVLVLASLYEKYRQGSQLALYYAGALGTLLFTLFLVLLSRVFPLPINGNDLLTYGGLAELLVLAFGLTVKYNLYKKEKENLLLALNRHQQETARRVIQAQENERERIAMDLHDELGASLSILKSSLLREQQKGESVVLVDTLSDTIRAISHDLAPPGFERFGLAKILRSSVDSLGKSGRLYASYYESGVEVRMQKDRELMVYRMASELLHNVIKHAQATELTVQLLYQPQHLVLQVEDNGVGIAPAAGKGGLGMESIHSRAQFLRANVSVDTNAQGTTFNLEIPYQ